MIAGGLAVSDGDQVFGKRLLVNTERCFAGRYITAPLLRAVMGRIWQLPCGASGLRLLWEER